MNTLTPDRKSPIMEPNEAYACVLKINRAYERVTGPSQCVIQQRSENEINVTINA